MSDGNDGNSSNSITFTRTCVPYYIHVRKEFKKSGVITVIPVTNSRKKISENNVFLKKTSPGNPIAGNAFIQRHFSGLGL